MRQELTWGAATAVAIIAAVGISSQSGKPQEGASRAGAAEHGVLSKVHNGHPRTACDDPLELLQSFFRQDVTAPPVCGDQPAPKPLGLRPHFVIATLPDPLHTHFSLLFDRLVEAIQQAAQDEGYDYDSSWLPWETEEPVALSRLEDRDKEEDRKAKREDQPGILLFRNTRGSPFEKGLIVFVVGEESTRGIHRKQFENAIAWIDALRAQGIKDTPVALLGPTFSGSFPSLSQLLASETVEKLRKPTDKLRTYSGSASAGQVGLRFAQISNIDFRSFVQDDDTLLNRFCRYFWVPDFRHIVILSEDETTYGNYSGPTAEESKKDEGFKNDDNNSTKPADNSRACKGATWLYYPRDISTLRAAYQTQSMFSSAPSQTNQETAQRRSLPTDLADPARQQHDTVRTYAGNQTTLSQEAQLLGIVDSLRAYHAEYIILRSSSTLDPLFLANFLRRDYPEARVVILNSDLLFRRGRDAMALNGVMTLSTYPLFPWAQEWTDLETFHPQSHRVFPENSTEGTYIASRMLLQSLSPKTGEDSPALQCEFRDDAKFSPALQCTVTKTPYVQIPDYAPPYWMKFQACEKGSSPEPCKPATWVSVITRTGTWPLAALNEHTLPLPDRNDPLIAELGLGSLGSSKHLPWPSMPRSMKVLLAFLVGLALFHAACCGFASFTAKPAFRAHFATAGWQHRALVLIGSYLIALMALITGWGNGVFARQPGPAANVMTVWVLVETVCGITVLAMIMNIVITRRLNPDAPHHDDTSQNRFTLLSVGIFFALIVVFLLSWVYPLEAGLRLASRTFVYWRSVNLTSGASPIVPFLSLTLGLYLWFWYSLHGLALFGPDRPCLPPLSTLALVVPGAQQSGSKLKLSMFSHEKAAKPAEQLAMPLARGTLSLIVFLFFFFWIAVRLASNVPVRSLGTKRYAIIFCFWMDLYVSLILAEAWQIWRTWSSVRQLLVFLDRLALRRTLGALHGFSWGSVWKMSGNVLDVRYKLLSRQLECLTHLHNSLQKAKLATLNFRNSLDAINDTRTLGGTFARWYSKNYNFHKARGLGLFKAFQKRIARTTGIILSELLIPATRKEEHSLIQFDPTSTPDSKPGPKPSSEEWVRNAEELVCLTYLGFAQNLLGRIRTIVLSSVSLFVFATIAVSSYPFDPRPVLSGVLLLLFIALGAVVVFVYADMHRDATLSHVTNTNPGELGSEFWLKVVGYGAAPVLGLVTTIFPEWSSFLFSWLQPGLSSLK
jgi:hypothetical protein